MKRYTIALTWLLAALLTASPALSESYKPELSFELGKTRFEFHGGLELELIDVEGRGGFSNQDLTTLKVANRSPHLNLDKAVFEPHILYSDWLKLVVQLRGNLSSFRVDRAYILFSIKKIHSTILVGNCTLPIAPVRRTEVYPLLGTAFWKGRTIQLSWDSKIPLGPVSLRIAAMISGQRPLSLDDVAEDRSFDLMVYGNYEPQSGNHFEGGGLVELSFYGVTISGWGFGGKLSDDEDLRYIGSNQLKRAVTAAGFNAEQLKNDDHWWYGGRLQYNGYGVGLVGEYIQARDGVIRREGWYAQLSYELQLARYWPGRWWSPFSLMLLGRYGQLVLYNVPESRDESVSWNRRLGTLAFIANYAGWLYLKIEYYWMMEDTGGTGEDANIRDNQLLIQLKMSF